MLGKVAEVKGSLESSSTEDIEGMLDGIIKDTEGRITLIRIEDKTEGGWATVEEYQTSDLAEDTDDDKKIRQANARALQKERKLQHRPSLTSGDLGDRYTIFRPYNTPRGRTAEPNDLCFRCGSKCHFKRSCKLESNLEVQESKLKKNQAAQQPVQWGTPAFSFSPPGAVPFTQTGSTRNTTA